MLDIHKRWFELRDFNHLYRKCINSVTHICLIRWLSRVDVRWNSFWRIENKLTNGQILFNVLESISFWQSLKREWNAFSPFIHSTRTNYPFVQQFDFLLMRCFSMKATWQTGETPLLKVKQMVKEQFFNYFVTSSERSRWSILKFEVSVIRTDHNMNIRSRCSRNENFFDSICVDEKGKQRNFFQEFSQSIVNGRAKMLKKIFWHHLYTSTLIGNRRETSRQIINNLSCLQSPKCDIRRRE